MHAQASSASKLCSGCQRVKISTAFFPSAYERDGLTKRCRCCVLQSAQEDREQREIRKARVCYGRRGKSGRKGRRP